MFREAHGRLEAARDGLWSVGRIEGRLTASDLVLEGEGLPVVRVDRRGRLARLSLRGLTVRRTMNGALHVGRRPRLEVVEPAEAAPFFDESARFFGALLALFRAQPDRYEPLALGASGPGEVELSLARASRFDADAARAESARFDAAYPEPVEILPPDRYRDVVVKPAVGCPNAGCTFCAFYAGKRFRPLSQVEFDAHLAAVEELFGPLLAQRTGVFLGSASAASLSDARLLVALRRIRERFGDLPKGVATFLDPDHAPRRDVIAWRALAEAGLRRVVSGLETGLPGLRERLGKSPDLDAFVATIRAQREGGVPVGLTVLVGVAGQDEMRHVEATAEVVASMELGRRDLVYVSPLDAGSSADSSQRARVMRDALAQVTDAPVAPYAMDRFGYYA